MDSNSSYFVRWRGKVSGPFSSSKIIDQLRAGQVSKHHQISDDRQKWVSICDHENFREACGLDPKPAGVSLGENEGGSSQGGSPLKLQKSVSSSGGVDEGLWYYAHGEDVVGPVSLEELQGMIFSRSIDQNVSICKEGEENWRYASELLAPPAEPIAAEPVAAVPSAVVVGGIYCKKCGEQNDSNAYQCIRCGDVLQKVASADVMPRNVPTYLTNSILVTLFCCLPFGIPAIVYSSQVNSYLQAGNIQGAIDASNKAKTWGELACLFGVLSSIAYFLLYGVGGYSLY